MASLICVTSPSVRSSPPVILMSTPVAPAIEMFSSSGLEIACCAASIARFSPRPVPVPISAAPPFCITVRTSAKSTLTSPVTQMSAEMPCVACSRTSSAFFNASWNGMPLLAVVGKGIPFQDALKKADDGEQPLVGYDDHRVDVLAHLGDAHFRLTHALAALEQKRLRHDSDRQRAQVPCDLRNDGRRAGLGAASHAAGDKHEVRALQGVQHFVAILFDGLAADFRPRPGAEPARQLFADLDFDIGFVVEERLSIGIDRNELDSAHVLVDHSVQGVAAAAADADDFHPRVLRNGFFEFEDHGSPLGLRRSLAAIA